MYEWDDEKRKTNLRKHGVDFAAIESFIWEEAFVQVDDREDYGETRYIAFGPIDGRLYCVWFAIRAGNHRIIGLRKANAREVAGYG